jgi:hypothetical protein
MAVWSEVKVGELQQHVVAEHRVRDQAADIRACGRATWALWKSYFRGFLVRFSRKEL